MSRLAERIGNYVKSPLRAMVRRAARAYVVGDCLSDALACAGRFAVQDICATLGYWDAVGESSDKVYTAYCAAIDGLGGENRDTYLSIKFPSLGFSCEALERLIVRAKDVGVRLHFDALAPETVDRTCSAIHHVKSLEADLGWTLPARWKRSPDDAQWAADHGLAVRVVKGQWPDPSAPRLDPQRGFAAVIERLAGRARSVAVATHDLTAARNAIERLQRAGTPVTLELLFGLPTQRQILLARELGVGVRIYIPYGAAYLPYCLAQLKRRPWQAWWLLRDAFAVKLRPAAAL